VRRLRVDVGDVLEIVVPDKRGGATLEPAITMTVDGILARHGGRPLTAEEFEEHFGELPSDGEG
jgi:hypothetical protein